MEAEQTVGSVFAIVTDAKEFYFLECTLDDQEKPSFKLSRPVVVVYEDEDMSQGRESAFSCCMVVRRGSKSGRIGR
jgi:hypothetical protein